jgi:hypothetical protein
MSMHQCSVAGSPVSPLPSPNANVWHDMIDRSLFFLPAYRECWVRRSRAVPRRGFLDACMWVEMAALSYTSYRAIHTIQYTRSTTCMQISTCCRQKKKWSSEGSSQVSGWGGDVDSKRGAKKYRKVALSRVPIHVQRSPLRVIDFSAVPNMSASWTPPVLLAGTAGWSRVSGAVFMLTSGGCAALVERWGHVASGLHSSYGY